MPRSGGRLALRISGWALIGIGAVLALYGFAPLLDALSIIGGNAQDPQGAMDSMIDAVKARIPITATGLGLLVVGAVLEAAGRRPDEAEFDDRVRGSLAQIGQPRCVLCGAPVPSGAKACTGGHEQ